MTGEPDPQADARLECRPDLNAGRSDELDCGYPGPTYSRRTDAVDGLRPGWVPHKCVEGSWHVRRLEPGELDLGQ